MTQIYLPRRGKQSRFGAIVPVGLNGKLTEIPGGVLTDQPDEIIAVLTTAGVPYRSTVAPVVPSGMILIQGTGSFVNVGLNGQIFGLPVDVPFTPTAAQRAALQASGITYLDSASLTYLGQPLTYLGQPLTYGAS